MFYFYSQTLIKRFIRNVFSYALHRGMGCAKRFTVIHRTYEVAGMSCSLLLCYITVSHAARLRWEEGDFDCNCRQQRQQHPKR